MCGLADLADGTPLHCAWTFSQGDVANSPEEVLPIAQKWVDQGAEEVVIKAQIHAGGKFIGASMHVQKNFNASLSQAAVKATSTMDSKGESNGAQDLTEPRT